MPYTCLFAHKSLEDHFLIQSHDTRLQHEPSLKGETISVVDLKPSPESSPRCTELVLLMVKLGIIVYLFPIDMLRVPNPTEPIYTSSTARGYPLSAWMSCFGAEEI